MRDHLITFLEFLAAAFIAATVTMCAERHIRPHAGAEAGTVAIDSVKTQIDTATAVAPEPSEIRHDTIYIRVVPKLPKSEPKLPESVPELPENVPEIADSVLYLPVVIEQKVYEDPDSTYRAVVSGPALSEEYGPRLDSIQVYSRTTIQYQTKTVYVRALATKQWRWCSKARPCGNPTRSRRPRRRTPRRPMRRGIRRS